MTWREKIAGWNLDCIYVLDAETCGIRQAKAECRVKPYPQMENKVVELAKQAYAEGLADALLKMKEAIEQG